MNLDVNAIFQQKLAEIQNRLASQLPDGIGDSSENNIAFEKFLSDASVLAADSDTNSIDDSLSSIVGSLDKTGIDRSAEVLRARKALASSTSYIPTNKIELMDLINKSIDSASQKYGVDKNLIRAVIKQESSFDPKSISNCGAQGLMQLMPGTADALGVTDPFNIQQNIDGGTQYLKDQLSSFNNNINLALAAYNAGPNSVTKYDGIPPYAETQDYVKKVTQYYNQYKLSGI
jgi:soluble lytic murein transglycosylase-like protein